MSKKQIKAKFEKGNKVIMHSCIEARHYEGIVWTCSTGEQDLCGSPVVWLEGFSGAFATKYLTKVDESQKTVQCDTCKKYILAESKGYEANKTIGAYWCKQCAIEEEKRQKLLKEFERMQFTHIVLKNEDIEELPKNMQLQLSLITLAITEKRIVQNKEPKPRYLVINTDEDQNFIEDIIKVMKSYKKWG